MPGAREGECRESAAFYRGRGRDIAASEKVFPGTCAPAGNHTRVKSGESATTEIQAPVCVGRNWPPGTKVPFPETFNFFE